jgi:hypothetical protein
VVNGVVETVDGAVDTVGGVINDATGGNVLPNGLDGCILATCGTNDNPVGQTGANLATTVNNTVQGVTGPLTGVDNSTTSGGANAAASSSGGTNGSAAPATTEAFTAGDTSTDGGGTGDVTLTVAGAELIHDVPLSGVPGTTGLVDQIHVCLVNCSTGSNTSALATVNATTRPVLIVPALSANACAVGTCDTGLMNGSGVAVGTLGIGQNNIIGAGTVGVCIIGQCAAGPNTSFNAIGGLLLSTDGGIVPFIDGVACVIGSCTINGQPFTGVLFTGVQTGDVLGLGPLGVTLCVVGACPGSTTPNTPGTPGTPNTPGTPGNPGNPGGPGGNLPFLLVNTNPGAVQLPTGPSANTPGGVGGPDSMGPGSNNGGPGNTGIGGPGYGGPQSIGGNGPMGLPNTGFAPLDALLAMSGSMGLVLFGLLAIFALWAAGMSLVLRSRQDTATAALE